MQVAMQQQPYPASPHLDFTKCLQEYGVLLPTSDSDNISLLAYYLESRATTPQVTAASSRCHSGVTVCCPWCELHAEPHAISALIAPSLLPLFPLLLSSGVCTSPLSSIVLAYSVVNKLLCLT
jgi:hypothetical protein